MFFKGLTTAAAAVALVAAPTVAAAQTHSVPRAAENLEGENELGRVFGGGGFIIPLLALAAIIAGILVLIDDNDDEPVSP